MTMTEQRTGTIAELHQRLVDEIHGKTGQSDRKLANNTYGRIEPLSSGAGGLVTIRLHSTDIAIIDPRAASYRTGGWYTVTTKERINRYLPGGWNLGAEKTVWYLSESLPNGEWEDDFGGPKYRWEKRSRFYDEIILRDTPSGVQVQMPKLDDPDAGMRHRINQYVKLYTDEQIDFLVKTAQSQDYKGDGDCWYCLMQDQTGKNLGDLTDNGHLEQHMIQRYTMVSLMINALNEMGANPGPWLSYGSRDGIRRGIRKYMLKRLTHREER